MRNALYSDLQFFLWKAAELLLVKTKGVISKWLMSDVIYLMKLLGGEAVERTCVEISSIDLFMYRGHNS